MSADVTTFDPTHINPWVAAFIVILLLIVLAALEVRASIREREEEARAYWIARQEANRTAHVPYGERCMMPRCGNRAAPDPYDGWRRCDGCKAKAARLAGGAA
ncbi:hypothetical protein [Knoellia sp. LjRoot47]|uniref:hypothetical protein n=1 Tax=Knoellia sp. LjRoot47 TaxID=3342330 RepID=UPI003ECD0478